MIVRDAKPADAEAACLVMRRSIAELCVADHGNDEAALSRWLANKKPEVFLAWLAEPHKATYVAVEGETVLGVGLVTDDGEIQLNYVSPDARFHGVSRALMRAMEARVAERGLTRCRLVSTETARRFYREAGYGDTGLPEGRFGTRSAYPMAKDLAPCRESENASCDELPSDENSRHLR